MQNRMNAGCKTHPVPQMSSFWRNWNLFKKACGYVIAISMTLAIAVSGYLPAVQALSYTFDEIDFPGASSTRVIGINNAGQIVGEYEDDSGVIHGFLLDEDLQSLERRRMVGGVIHGFVLDEDSFTTIDFPDAVETKAFGINNAGQIVGFYKDSSGDVHGFLLDSGTFSSIDFPGATAESQAFGINNAGQIVGQYDEMSGFLLDNGSFTTTDFPDADESEALDINNAGQIVGFYRVGRAVHGFLLENGSFTTIDFPGAFATGSVGINDDSVIVGGYFDGRAERGYMATPEEAAGTTPEPPEEEEDFSNVFFTSLSEGLNMISLPLKPRTPFTARSFAEELSSTMVVKYDETRRRFVGFTLDAPGNGFAIEGGKGYIVNVAEDETVTFTGAAWTNEPSVEAAPPLAVGSPDSAWAFVVSGRIDGGQAPTAQDASFVRGSFYVTVRNTRTSAVATDEIRTGYFAAAFADLSRQSVVEVGDRLEVTVMDQTGEIASDPIQITVTAETLRQAFVPITLTGVGKPSQSQLLQNYPNPFNPETWLPYQLADAAKVTIQIYDSSGRVVRTLDLGLKPAGFYTRRFTAAYWDGRNGTGERVASGVYFYTLQTDNPLQTEKFAATRKMLIAK